MIYTWQAYGKPKCEGAPLAFREGDKVYVTDRWDLEDLENALWLELPQPGNRVVVQFEDSTCSLSDVFDILTKPVKRKDVLKWAPLPEGKWFRNYECDENLGELEVISGFGPDGLDITRAYRSAINPDNIVAFRLITQERMVTMSELKYDRDAIHEWNDHSVVPTGATKIVSQNNKAWMYAPSNERIVVLKFTEDSDWEIIVAPSVTDVVRWRRLPDEFSWYLRNQGTAIIPKAGDTVRAILADGNNLSIETFEVSEDVDYSHVVAWIPWITDHDLGKKFNSIKDHRHYVIKGMTESNVSYATKDGPLTITNRFTFMEKVFGNWLESAASKAMPTGDAVNHPSHYNQGGIEVLDVIKAYDLNFNTGNTVKYVLRAGKKSKDTYLQDLKKAQFYLEYEINELEKKDGTEG